MKKRKKMTNAEINALFKAEVEAFYDKNGYYPGFAKLAYDDPQVRALWQHARQRMRQSEARLAKFRRPELKTSCFVLMKELQLCAQWAFMAAMLSDGKQHWYRKAALAKAWKMAAECLAERTKVERRIGEPVELAE
ncbi:MAG: hypothetical protein GYA36_18970 [Veillonellaceae bacterium]|nr:hypothetical protein [Veillonellaceae bacterium]